jgi:K+ transporter
MTKDTDSKAEQSDIKGRLAKMSLTELGIVFGYISTSPIYAILSGLFLIQWHGMAKVGGLFGPVTLAWLCFLGITGGIRILQAPQILAAVFPWYQGRTSLSADLENSVLMKNRKGEGETLQPEIR